MTASVISVETEDLERAAATVAHEVGDPLTTAVVRLIFELQESGSMAGAGPAGQVWAGEYDRAVAIVLGASGEAINASYRLSTLFAQTALNYAAADTAADPRGRALDAAAARLVGENTPIGLSTSVPSVAGGAGGGPPGWGLVEGVVGRLWPDGQPGRLRAAGQAWAAAGATVEDLAVSAGFAANPAISDRLPEYPQMFERCDQLGRQLRGLGQVYWSVGAGCSQLAEHIEAVHARVEGELVSLLEWTAGIEAAGALASLVSFGAAQIPTQLAESARIAAVAARITRLIDELEILARAITDTVVELAERAGALGAELRLTANLRILTPTLIDARPVATLIRQIEVGPRLRVFEKTLPDIRTTTGQLGRKLKHAAAFGVPARGPGALSRFEAVARDFIRGPETVRKLGTYRGRRAILNFDRQSGLCILQKPSGELISDWRLTPRQLMHVEKTGALGGG